MIYGILLLFAAGVAGIVFGVLSQRRMGAMAQASTVGCVDLPQVAGEGEPVTLEVVGRAGAGKGPLTAPFSGTRCVWYRTKVTHRYRERRRRGSGDSEWVTKNDTIAEDASNEPISITDISGAVWVFPNGAKVIGDHESLDRFEHHRPGSGPPASGSLGARALSMAGDLLNRYTDTTIGYRYEEWVLHEGTELYVLAGAKRDQNGTCWLERPAGGPFLISTKSEKQLSGQARLGAVGGYALGGVAVLASAAWGVIALVA